MMLIHRRLWPLVLGGIVCAAAAGCTGSDPIPTRNGTAVIQLEATSSEIGRFDDVAMRLTKFEVRPEDPDAQALVGTNPITLLRRGLVWSVATGNTEAPSVVLPPGQYRVTELVFDAPILIDNDPEAPTSCLESFATLPAPGQVGVPNNSFFLDESVVDTTITVPVATASRFTVAFDLSALVQAYQDAFTCQRCPSDPSAFCLTSFDNDAFSQAMADNVSIR